MEYICAYFDTQGFYINGSYHPVEVVIFDNEYLVHVKVAKTCDCNPSSKEENQIKYLETNHHGFRYDNWCGGIDPYELKEMLLAFYQSCRSNTKLLVACRSKEAESLLDNFNIPKLNINESYGASFKQIDLKNEPCYLHCIPTVNYKCSLNIVQYMKKHMDFVKENGIDVID